MVSAKRLAAIQVELDQCWDLLRQRRALREFGHDPAQANVRAGRGNRRRVSIDANRWPHEVGATHLASSLYSSYRNLPETR
jgi:Protein of unknown function (DUF2630)